MRTIERVIVTSPAQDQKLGVLAVQDFQTALKGRILIGCRRKGAEIRVDVYDTGIGIPEDQLPRIFDAFKLPLSQTWRRPGHRTFYRSSCA